MNVSACIPVFNGAATLAAAIASVRAQSVPVREIVVVDDGSSDDSRAVAESLRARVVAHPANLGRGAARATGVRECGGELILFCDAAIALAPEFLETALPLFQENSLAAVFGRVSGEATSVAHRWRERHLFRTAARTSAGEDLLATGGSLLRRSSLLAVGNFNAQLRAGEDAEMGQRLAAAGQRMLFEPRLKLTALGRDSVRTVLRRYARWNGQQRPSWKDYLRFINYGVKVMVPADLRERDFASALVSLASPHVLFWRARRKRQHEQAS